MGSDPSANRSVLNGQARFPIAGTQLNYLESFTRASEGGENLRKISGRREGFTACGKLFRLEGRTSESAWDLHFGFVSGHDFSRATRMEK